MLVRAFPVTLFHTHCIKNGVDAPVFSRAELVRLGPGLLELVHVRYSVAMTHVIFDWKRTLYDPEKCELLPGAYDLLSALAKKDIPMILIGKGDTVMHAEVERLGVRAFFTEITFREGAKEAALFRPYVDSSCPKQTIVVGDRARSELAVGNSLGATTIWVRQGKFAVEEPEPEVQKPTHVVASLSEVKPLLELLLP